MIKGIIFFLALWAVVTGGINVWRSLTGKEKWDTIKCVWFGAVTCVITFIIVTVMVVLF